ncbi:uncharacterized protein LOC119279665 [Triticum dicoccoides]|uniref:uncharacterized protein LOC119279665 n=1 Tax=Triticum dicoccoides TaxID=85692 RepID=UPI00188FAD0C|nr:uncharacterized protein LOC119279665 [Triticum dicoccoides]
MVDKPSRALVLYAAGHAALLAGGGGGKVQLDAFASIASCGFLSVRTLAVNGELCSGPRLEMPICAKRDGGTEDFAAQSGSGSSSKDTRIIDRAFTLLGFAERNVQDASEFDLVFVHAVMENTASKLGKLGMKTNLNRLDKLVASVMEAAPVGSAVAARIHVSVILSYGSATANKEEACLILNSSTETDSDLKSLRPQITLLCISCRNHHPMLLAQWQQGVTRSDLAKELSFEEFIKACGGDTDGRREIRGLDGVVAADGFLRPLVVRHEHDIDRGLLELRVRARDVTASQLKAVAAVGQVWLARLLDVFHRSCRPHDQAGQALHID